MTIRIDGTNTTANPGMTGGDADTGLVFGTDEVKVVTGGTDRVTVGSTGNLSIAAGNLVLASGSGIDFSATADGSGTMTSELLDDYEEGTFTPVLEGSTTAGTYTYGAQVGMYTKIGRVVNSTLVLTDITVSSAGSGSLVITGFPFVSSSTTSINFNGAARTDSLTFGSSTNYVVPTMSANQSGIGLQNIKDGLPDSSVNVTSSIASGQTDIFINITYMVD